MDQTIDPKIKNLVSAIGRAETGNPSPDAYNAKGASGEFGRYQFLPDTWKMWAPESGVDVNDRSMAAQNKVAYNKVKQWKDQGLNPAQIASKWNSGDENAYMGTFKDGKPSSSKAVGGTPNSQGVEYDVPGYAMKVSNYYKQLSGNNTQNVSTETPSESSGSGIFNTIGKAAGAVTGVFGMNPLLKGIGQTIANATGSQDAAIEANQRNIDIQTQLLSTIKANKAAGKDTTKLESALKDITSHILESGNEATDIGTQGITSKDVIGSAISTAATAIPGASAGASLLTKTIAGGATGYAFDVGSNLQNKDKTLGQDFTPGLGTIVGATLPFAGYLISSLSKKIAGFTAGTGEDVIQRAIDNPDAVGEAISKYAKTPEAKEELVSTASSAVQDFVKAKGQEFGNTINNLAVKEGGEISKQPALEALKKSLEDFGITLSPEGLDFTNSNLTKEAESTLNQVFDKITNWSDETPKGLDSLRQYLKGEMGNYKIQGSSKVDSILNTTMKAIRSHLTDEIPGYAEMLQNFSEKSSTTTALLKELQLAGTAKPSTKLANILKIFKKDPTVLDNLYKVMGKSEAEDFLNQVSGAILSDWIPAGKVGNAMRTIGEAGLGVGLHAVGVGTAPALGAVGAGMAVSSPRVVGSIARTVGSRTGRVASEVVKKGITSGVSKLNP